MDYTKFNLDEWDRREHYLAFTNFATCAFSMTSEVDITGLIPWVKDKNYKFYPTMIYLVASVVNQFKEFQMDVRDGELIVWNQRNPCYTIFHKDKETFSSLWSDYDSDLELFISNYERDYQAYKNDSRYFPKGNIPPNLFYISAIPWVTFSSFNLHFPTIDMLYAPTFTMGKYFERDGCVILPIAIQIHHAVADGFHVARFFNTLQGDIRSLIQS